MAPQRPLTTEVLITNKDDDTKHIRVEHDGTNAVVNVSSGSWIIKLLGNTLFTIASTLLTLAKPLQLPTYTVSNAPNANIGAGTLIYVSNGNAGAKCLAMSDGTNWKVIALGSTIAAS